MDRLIQAIRDYQKEHQPEATDAKMAARLGVSRTAWRAIRLGEYRPRLGFAKRCLRLFEFEDAARKALLE